MVITPSPPSSYHDWNGSAWVLNVQKMRDGIIKKLSETGTNAQNAIVRYSPGKAEEYKRNLDMIRAADSADRTSFLLGKSISFAGRETFNGDGSLRCRVVAGDIQSFIDFVNDASSICLAAGDAIVNGRGDAILRMQEITELSEAEAELADHVKFCEDKLLQLKKQAP